MATAVLMARCALPHRPLPASSAVIVQVGSIGKLTEHALHAALSLGDEVIAVSVHPEAGQGAAFHAEWDRWDPGVPLDPRQPAPIPGPPDGAGG